MYVLARRERIRLERYGIDAATLIEVGRLEGDLGGPSIDRPVSKSRLGKPKVSPKPLPGIEPSRLPRMMVTHASAVDRSVMAFRHLYLIENSVRELIRRVLMNRHGPEWWGLAVPKKVRDAGEYRQKQDLDDPWFTPRGDHPIYYLDLHHYAIIITESENWTLFEPFFKRKEFVSETLRDVNLPRRVVAHMNPLRAEDLDHLKAAYRKWMGQLIATEDQIP